MTDPKQKPSAIITEQTGRGFPAEFISNITSDARADNQTRNSPTITGFVDKHIRLKHPYYRTSGFFPRHCNDNQGVTVASLPGDKRLA